MARGKLIILSGPTGSGKGTLMRNAMERFPELSVLDSYTTRTPRPDHVENDHYKFVSVEEFRDKIEKGAFLEWAQFSGNYYGTLKADAERCIEEGKVVIKEMEVQGVRQVKKLLPEEDYISIFIDGGSWKELVARALKRDPLSDEELARRKARYDDELTFMPEADIVIHNKEGQLEEADRAFEEVIESAFKGN